MLVNFDQISRVLIGKDNNGCLKRGVKHASTTTNYLTLLPLISCTHYSSLPDFCLQNLCCIYPQNSRNLFHKSLVLITDDRWLVNISDVSQEIDWKSTSFIFIPCSGMKYRPKKVQF